MFILQHHNFLSSTSIISIEKKTNRTYHQIPNLVFFEFDKLVHLYCMMRTILIPFQMSTTHFDWYQFPYALQPHIYHYCSSTALPLRKSKHIIKSILKNYVIPIYYQKKIFCIPREFRKVNDNEQKYLRWPHFSEQMNDMLIYTST